MKKIKLIGFIIIVLCCFNIHVEASTKTIDRNTQNNYGVKKKWDINDKNKNNVLRTPLVNADEKIYDFANILTDEEEKRLYEKINTFITDKKMDVVILTYNTSYTQDKQNDDFGADFYDYNDFGIDFEHYSGVLLLRNAYSTDPYFNILTFGEAKLYFENQRCEKILDYIYSDFYEHRYESGITKFVNQLDKYYKDGISKEMRDHYIDDTGNIQLHKVYHFPWGWAFVISLGSSIGITAFFVAKNKMIKKASRANVYLDATSVNYSKKQDLFLHSHTTHYTISSSSGGGGGHSSIGSSGGSHGGGSGRHG